MMDDEGSKNDFGPAKPDRAKSDPAGGGSYFIYSECRIFIWCFTIIVS